MYIYIYIYIYTYIYIYIYIYIYNELLLLNSGASRAVDAEDPWRARPPAGARPSSRVQRKPSPSLAYI